MNASCAKLENDARHLSTPVRCDALQITVERASTLQRRLGDSEAGHARVYNFTVHIV